MEPAIGKFTTVDPHAENYYSWSPYAYVGNNPLKYIDPTGMFYDDYFDENTQFLGSDTQSTDNVRVISRKSWNRIQSQHYEAINIRSTKDNHEEYMADLLNSSRELSIEAAGDKFKKMWNESLSSNKEKIEYMVFDFDNATLTFESVVTVGATNQTVRLDYRAGDKFKGGKGIVLGNTHSHPDEHTYLGKTLLGGGKEVR